MSLLIFKSGKVELRKESGLLIQTLGNGHAIDANLNQIGALILLTLDSGMVEHKKKVDH
ncbi:hypothetical protein [Mucilaginibacter terrae]|uniref:Uncharacterized protein n=1 Tax=Mucilaginibacter terrae TaxID=1955052 RepID=A0ABU3GUI1_9SPHI|nr:hypothetical protein [Mucilaginibacter terrae]MDT3403441.1 hypothetical protein [Mucilaginibacter terrae]